MNRLVVLGILTYILALVGLALLNGSIIALVIPFLIVIGAGLIYGPDKPNIELARTVSRDRIEEGTAVNVSLVVTNIGRRLELVQITDSPPPKLAILDGETSVLASLATGESVELKYTLRGERGRYDFGHVRLRASDLLKLFARETLMEVPGRFELFIHPEIRRIERIPIRPRQTKAFAGPIPARIGGTGLDFFGVRNYQPGDALRHINWRANARHPDTFFTNEYEQERVADVGIVLDARQRSNIDVGANSLFEYAIQATAALSSSFLGDGNRVALLRYGDFLDWIAPGYGKLQLERVLHALARAQTGDSLVFDQLENLPTRLFPPKSQIVLVSPLISDDAQFLPRLLARGYSVLVVSPDPVSFEINLLTEADHVNAGARIARMERELLLRRIRQSGIQVLDWDVRIPFEQMIGSSVSSLRPTIHRHMGVVN